VVAPLSMDEAFLDLAAADLPDLSVASVTALGLRLKDRVHEVTGGLTGSVGIATSKLVAKIASDLDKPDGLVVVEPGTELDLLRPMNVSVIPGVGPATSERLRRIGVHTVEELHTISEDELVRVVGQAHGRGLYRLSRAEDDRAVVPERETKSISIEDTYETDHVDKRLLEGLLDRQATKVAERLRTAKMSGRTVTVKIRLHDFSTHTRSATLPAPTDDRRVVSRLARTLIGEVDTSGGVRLLGVGVSGLADWIQDDLFADEEADAEEVLEAVLPELPATRTTYAPGMDVVHEAHGPGWVWGSGRGVVTVRFETAETGPGKVMSFAIDDPALSSLHRPRR
jgi:DNA polymerase-4